MSTQGYLMDDLLRIHERHSHRTPLKECFCDGFLYDQNAIYRSVRKAYLGCGGGFTFDDYCHSKAFPGLSLPSFLNSGRVVVFDNLSPMRHFAEKSPGLPFELFQTGANAYMRNNLFHEPVHFICYKTLFGSRPLDATLPKSPDTVLRILMSEALTHGAEAFASTCVSDEAHYLILNFTLHQRIEREELAWRKKARQALGPEGFFRAFFFAALFGQFAYLLENDDQLRKFLAEVRVPRKTMATHFSILKRMFASQMSPRGISYKIIDGELFFRLLGFDKPILEILDFDFISLFWETPGLQEAFARLEGLILGSHFGEFKQGPQAQAEGFRG